MAKYIEREALEISLNHRLNFLMAEYGEYNHYTSGFDGAVTMVENFPAADVEPVQEWIPVEGRTPGNTGLYLVIEKHWLDGSLGIKIAKWNTVDWFTADRKSKKITPRVTHWMPLPPLPKGE